MIQFNPVNKNSFYDFARKVYEESFPLDERRDFDKALEMQLSFPVYFNAILVDDIAVGISVIWDLPNFTYLEHFAIDPEQKGNGLGTKILNKILLETKKQVILEVEKPETLEAERRIIFYKRLGLHLNDTFNFNQPPYDITKKSLYLFLMSRFPLIPNEYEDVKNVLYKTVYQVKDK